MKTTLDFSFGVLALKLLGKNLYSNPITAISELVANGLDANANEIKVFIDMRNKENSIIEIYDNGIGMSLDDIKRKYCEVGYKKRADADIEKDIDLNKVMGRKGIGKLAALYLSDLYYIISKKQNFDLNCYEVDIRDYDDSNPINEKAQMSSFNVANLNLDNDLSNEKMVQGTIIRIEEINLKGFGEAGIAALNWKLANYFSLENLEPHRSIKVKVIQSEHDLNKEYEEVTKNILFQNMYMISSSYSEDSDFYKKIANLNSKIEFKPPKLQKIEYNHKDFEAERKIEGFPKGSNAINTKGELKIKNQSFNYELKGWIGIHSSIKGDNFISGDEGKIYSKFYNPNQLRLYIRNKLAVENLMPKLKNTQAFANYIEGEIFFDILDLNGLSDITTSNRQDIDENDERVSKLIGILKPIVNNLIQARIKIGHWVTEKEKAILGDIDTNNKTRFINKAREHNFTSENIDFLANNLKGETLKSTARIFISHNTDNKPMVDFVYYSLIHLGVDKDEVFYTSKNEESFTKNERETDIINAMKNNINNLDTLMLYFVTPCFLNSRFTLFESGAGWVTKNQDSFLILTYNLERVKNDLEILYNRQFLYSLCDRGMFRKWLSKDTSFADEDEIDNNIMNYNNIIVPFFNTCINHLNEKRKIKKINLLKNLEEIQRWEDANFGILDLWNKHLNEKNYKKFIENKFIESKIPEKDISGTSVEEKI